MTAREEHGSATVAVVSLIGVVLLVALSAAAVLGAAVAHRRAQAAADLAALAGATAAAAGDDGCRAASGVATANGARLDTCSETDGDLLVAVSASVPGSVPFLAEVSARARAGPS